MPRARSTAWGLVAAVLDMPLTGQCVSRWCEGAGKSVLPKLDGTFGRALRHVPLDPPAAALRSVPGKSLGYNQYN